MYKVFLVEDEILVREAIRDNIDWAGAGFDFVGEASDGELALPLIEDTKPDIVITDIKMPFMDGLEFSRFVKKNMPWMKIVILSGHDEFTYTKEAISINVDEYLLKPLSSNDLLSALKKVVAQIEYEKSQREDDQVIRNRLKDGIQVMKEKFLCDLATGVVPYSEAIEKAEYFGINIISKYYAVVLIELKCQQGRKRNEEYFEYLKAETILKKIIEKNDHVFKYSMNLKKMVLINKNDNAADLKANCHKLVQSIRHEVEKNTSCCLTASIGSIRERIQGIARSLEDAETIMDCSCLFSKNRMMGIHDAKLSQVNNRVFIPLDETKLLEFLRYQDEAYILSKLSVYIQSIKDQDLDPVYYTYLFSGITQAVVRFVEELGENVEDIIPELSCIVEMIDRVYSIDGFIYHTRKLISKIIEFRESKKHNKYGDVIWKARKFIDLNYSDSRLSLNMVAKHVNVSPSHFSTIFSQEIGMTFIEYLTSVRIAKAKEKLRTTNLKSSEIAYKVGYNDHHYFSHVFKKETGLRPTDFRANHSPESKII